MAREYRDSGIEWIGQIPKEWKIELIGNNIKEINEKNDDSSDDNALQFKMGTIISKKGGDSKYNPESLVAYTKVKEGDIVINGLNLSFDFISQRVGLVRENGVITSTYLTLRPSSLLHSEFVNYLFKAYDNCKAFHGMGRGLRQILAYRELKNQKLVYPSLFEQQKIADYLDKVCGEVDEMVTLQETMIEELKAYKQSVITEAVTKGLNPNVPMRNSGIDWIGEIPEHWDISRLKFYSSFINGYAFSSDIFTIDKGCKVIRIGDISQNLDFDGCVRADVKTDSLQQYRIITNDIVIAMSGATTGKCCIAKDVEEAYINQRVGIIRCDNYIYTYYQLQTDYFMEYIKLNNAGSAQPNISGSSIGNFPILVPPEVEQRTIASFLDTKCSEIDSLIALKQAKIEELKEYKKSVIYEYVTGKKEVV